MEPHSLLVVGAMAVYGLAAVFALYWFAWFNDAERLLVRELLLPRQQALPDDQLSMSPNTRGVAFSARPERLGGSHRAGRSRADERGELVGVARQQERAGRAVERPRPRRPGDVEKHGRNAERR